MDHQAHSEGHAGGSGHAEGDGVHGMLVVGQDTVFFYHLPMFMSPHDYQVILEGTLSQPGADPQRTYREDRKGHPETPVYTFAPVPYVLPDLFPPAPKRRAIQGDLFRGHFERPPEYPEKPFKIGTGVDVTIANVIFVKKLLPVSSPPDHLEYVLFGKGPRAVPGASYFTQGRLRSGHLRRDHRTPVFRRRAPEGSSRAIHRQVRYVGTAAREGREGPRNRSCVGQERRRRGGAAGGALHVGTRPRVSTKSPLLSKPSSAELRS